MRVEFCTNLEDGSSCFELCQKWFPPTTRLREITTHFREGHQKGRENWTCPTCDFYFAGHPFEVFDFQVIKIRNHKRDCQKRTERLKLKESRAGAGAGYVAGASAGAGAMAGAGIWETRPTTPPIWTETCKPR